MASVCSLRLTLEHEESQAVLYDQQYKVKRRGPPQEEWLPEDEALGVVDTHAATTEETTVDTIAAKHKSRQSPSLVEVTTRLDAGDVNRGDTSDMAGSLDHADSGCQEASRRQNSFQEIPKEPKQQARALREAAMTLYEEGCCKSWTAAT